MRFIHINQSVQNQQQILSTIIDQKLLTMKHHNHYKFHLEHKITIIKQILSLATGQNLIVTFPSASGLSRSRPHSLNEYFLLPLLGDTYMEKKEVSNPNYNSDYDSSDEDISGDWNSTIEKTIHFIIIMKKK